MAPALVIAVMGAESTGKTTLCAALAARMQQESGLRCTWVDEWLRLWCEREDRSPRLDEQAAVAEEQARRIDAAALTHDVVVCDTTPLMTAVYNRWVFNDRSLDERSAVWHQRVSLTLVTAIDLPWVHDGLQREGPHVREPVDGFLRELLLAHNLPFAVIGGTGPARLDHAAAAVAPLLLRRLLGSKPRKAGMFTRLHGDAAVRAAEAWSCECCDDADCERQLHAAR